MKRGTFLSNFCCVACSLMLLPAKIPVAPTHPWWFDGKWPSQRWMGTDGSASLSEQARASEMANDMMWLRLLTIDFWFIWSFEPQNSIRDSCKDCCNRLDVLRKWSAETWQPWFGLAGSCTSYFGSVAWFTFVDAGPLQGWTSELTWSSWMMLFWIMNFSLNR